MAILETHNLSVGFTHGKQAVALLEHIDLSLQEGSLVALLGRNGAGKSTLLRALTCDAKPLSGNIMIDGMSSVDLSPKSISRYVALVATEHINGGAFTIRELVSLGRFPFTGFLGRLSKHDNEVVDECLEAVGILHKANQHVADLSDGERQKAMIAKALAQETPIVILDEPTAFLDVASRIETMKLLHTLAHDKKKAVLLSSHDISQSLLLADELWVITNDNQLIAGTTESVVMSKAMDKVFGTDAIVFNSLLCDYEAQLLTSREAKLVCDDKALMQCVTNALLRNGISISGNATSTITAKSVNNYIVDGTSTFTDIKDVVNFINNSN